jgi:hypothetical protein
MGAVVGPAVGSTAGGTVLVDGMDVGGVVGASVTEAGGTPLQADKINNNATLKRFLRLMTFSNQIPINRSSITK